MQEMWVRSLGWEDPLKEGMEAHSVILAWRIPWTEESGGLQSKGSQRVRHDWSYWAKRRTRRSRIDLFSFASCQLPSCVSQNDQLRLELFVPLKLARHWQALPVQLNDTSSGCKHKLSISHPGNSSQLTISNTVPVTHPCKSLRQTSETFWSLHLGGFLSYWNILSKSISSNVQFLPLTLWYACFFQLPGGQSDAVWLC